MQPSTWLYDFLKQHERFRPTAYKPTPKDVWTLGWGHTHGVRERDTCTMPTAQAWLEQDVAVSVAAIAKHCTAPLTQSQLDALCSFVFNVGAGAFEESTLLRKLNDYDYSGAAAEFLRWNKQAGAVLDGLTTRREAEKARFETAEPLIA